MILSLIERRVTMARRKTITREDILQAAFKLVSQEGFGHFTARSVAKKVGSSTQPIYLEFENMDDLKAALYEKIYAYLGNEVFPKVHTGDVVVDMSLNYIHFAKRENRLFYALYLDEASDGQRMNRFSHDYFLKMIKQSPEYENYSPEKIESLHTGSLIVATGIAALMSSGIINPTDEEIISLIKEGIKFISSLEKPILLG